MNKEFIDYHNWSASKIDCASVDCHCTVDRDCAAACHNQNSLNSHEVIAFRCNKTTLRCEGRVVSSIAYDMAVEDLGRLRNKMDKLPDNLKWYLQANDGRMFVVPRARYYEKKAIQLAWVNDVKDKTASMRKKSAARSRDALMQRLEKLDLNETDYQIALEWILEITIDGQDYEETGTEESYNFSNYLSSILGADTVEHHQPSVKNHPLKLAPYKMDLCNEEMNAGRTIAVYQGMGEEDKIPMCVCTYPEYLTGPACKHRTYHHVIDYNKWERDNYPTFLVDPIIDYKSAEKVCRELPVASTSVYDEIGRGFFCIPLADWIGRSFTYRAPYEAGIIMDSSLVTNETVNNEYVVNSSYLDLLERLK